MVHRLIIVIKLKQIKDINKQLIQEIINAGNKAIESSPVKYTIETKDMTYYGYDGLYYDNNHVEFVDDYDYDIVLEYDKITGIKVSDI
nr:MAG TPA: hypothetical protein [Crassvirales sp.]